MEDTQNREAEILEAIQKNETAGAVATESEKEAVTGADDGIEMGAVKRYSGADYKWVWDTRTYRKVPVLSYMLAQVLRQKRGDGSYQFTSKDPGKEPIRGTFKCLLHSESPNRAHYDELGFRVCKKSNLRNQYQVTQHMKSRHPAEWAAIEEERRERERKEDRDAQQLLYRTLANSTPDAPQSKSSGVMVEEVPETEAPLYVSENPKPRKKRSKK